MAIPQAGQAPANIESLHRLAIWLEGIKQGRGGSLEPLGTIVIDELWKAIHELEERRKRDILTTRPSAP